jgi:hypothetical protein
MFLWLIDLNQSNSVNSVIFPNDKENFFSQHIKQSSYDLRSEDLNDKEWYDKCLWTKSDDQRFVDKKATEKWQNCDAYVPIVTKLSQPSKMGPLPFFKNMKFLF